MPSFDVVNYSLRPSKSIQRQIIFDGINILQTRLGLDLSQFIYIGLGSIWFTDFVMAHKLLGIKDMISMEEDCIGYRRALFNAPYATVNVRKGSSSTTLPKLFDDKDISQRPWLIWLDYDREFGELLQEDTRDVIERAPGNTIFLITFNGNDSKYGKPKARPERLRRLFGDLVPDDLSKEECKTPLMQEILAGFAIDSMQSVASNSMRRGGFIPAFRILYKDGADMVTVGGFLASSQQLADKAQEIVEEADWKCRPKETIVAPHLTIREAVTLQSNLPNTEGLSRKIVQSLGFDLGDNQIKIYQKYYREYPSFAQIIT